MDIKNKIREIMNEQGYTIYSLSKTTGLSQTTIANWFNKINNEPSISALEKICEAFSITMAELFSCEEDTMLPCNNELKDIFGKWQKLTPEEKTAVIVHINSYLKCK